MADTFHLTLANDSLDSAAQPTRSIAAPATCAGRLREKQAQQFRLLFAAQLELAGVRSCARAAAPNDVRDTTATCAAEQTQAATNQSVILIADDDDAIRDSLAAVLRSERYEVRLAENGRTAVRQFLDGPPDLILLDLNMPDTDGWQAFEVMARLAPQVPVIIITARPYQARRAAEAGIDMLLEKPLDIRVLLETIRDLLAAPEKSRFAKVLRAWHTNDLPDAQG